MAETLKVSLVVPVYNGEATIDACIQSLLALDYPADHRELIFVDNASTDRTAELLRLYSDKVRLSFEARKGPAAARNNGLRKARHEIVAMTDADCTVDSGWLRHLTEPLRDPSIGLVGGTILSKRPGNAIELFGEKIHDHRSAIEVWQPPYVITMNWASRRSVLRQVDFFDEQFMRCEDVDLAYRAFEQGVKFGFASKAIVYHQNENSLVDLSREGYLHGYYSVQAIKKHKALLAHFGHRRFHASSYRALWASLKETLAGSQHGDARYDLVFNAGKKIGKLCGSVRFRYLDL